MARGSVSHGPQLAQGDWSAGIGRDYRFVEEDPGARRHSAAFALAVRPRKCTGVAPFEHK
jgi:hypothetical protein